jgi:hypothetical protein
MRRWKSHGEGAIPELDAGAFSTHYPLVHLHVKKASEIFRAHVSPATFDAALFTRREKPLV